jgi:hypothetical protein
MSTWWVKPLLIGLAVLAVVGAIKWYGHSQFVAGEAAKDAEWREQMREAEKMAAIDSQGLLQLSNGAGKATYEFTMGQLEKSHAEQKSFREALAAAESCVVPGAAVRMLDNATDPNGADYAGSSGKPGPAVSTADSTCAEQLDIARRNYREVCLPNAKERDELRNLYNDTRDVINK